VAEFVQRRCVPLPGALRTRVRLVRSVPGGTWSTWTKGQLGEAATSRRSLPKASAASWSGWVTRAAHKSRQGFADLGIVEPVADKPHGRGRTTTNDEKRAPSSVEAMESIESIEFKPATLGRRRHGACRSRRKRKAARWRNKPAARGAQATGRQKRAKNRGLNVHIIKNHDL